MTATLIDGKAFAETVRAKVADGVAHVKSQGLTPGLAVVLVGDNPASEVYVRNKKAKTVEVGMESFAHQLPADTTQESLLNLIAELNDDARVHGILVQLPLPDHIDEHTVINAISPAKDVDGFHVVNTGKLATAQSDALVPCTPLGCLMMLQDHFNQDLSGKHAVIIGRSNIVGKPMAALLLNESCTVTICHSRTQDIKAHTQRADIVVAAVGRPHMVDASWLKDGAVVIDVGINRVDAGEGKTRLVGDVDTDSAMEVASAITPVPGGVGPMTIACLLRNTLQAACTQANLVFPLAE
ncbi:MAG: bifunctional methylenetetrahydrofolate dehydrogenase/methenyltetrahydrofolate cyclohydrolase FolD [Rickettsiales bacterium]|nr:bifunctional methylenetetrahydrofolate dehydrogenase/methenyltetrahydrofolate cyclohydrolase FolD [Rickettsiales bacterium]